MSRRSRTAAVLDHLTPIRHARNTSYPKWNLDPDATVSFLFTVDPFLNWRNLMDRVRKFLRRFFNRKLAGIDRVGRIASS